MNAPDRIALRWQVGEAVTNGPLMDHPDFTRFLREDGPTITAYREALRLLGVDPDSIAREAEKEASNG